MSSEDTSVDQKLTDKTNLSSILPLELMDQCRNNKIMIIMVGPREFYGTLIGYDEHVNVVLQDVTEVEYSQDGIKKTHLNEILLVSSYISAFVPGGTPPE